MITRFGVAGFRGIGRYQEVDIAPITVITGPNSAGKSSLLEAIRVTQQLVRTCDHTTLFGQSSTSALRRFHPEYVFGGDASSKTLFEITPAKLLDYELEYRAGPQRIGGVSVRLTIESKMSTSYRHVWTALKLYNESGTILDLSWNGKARINWRHPLFNFWIYTARQALVGWGNAPHLVESAMPLVCGGFDAASMFSWVMPQEEDYARGSLFPGIDRPYDEETDVLSLGEFALGDLALKSEENADTARSVVEALGVADAISLVMDLEDSKKPDLMRFADQRAMLGADLFDRLESAVPDVDWRARDLYSVIYTRGQLLLQRLRNEVFRSLPNVTLVAANRRTPPNIVVEPPSGYAVYGNEAPLELESRVNAWLGSDKLGTGFRFVREQLLTASEAQLGHASAAEGPRSDSSKTYQQYLIDLATGMRHSFADVGYGLAQVLPVLLQLYGRRFASLHIEQPESHLHPALQADLADAAIVSAKKLSNQVALETHSEHLILRLLRRIRETTEHRAPSELQLAPEDIAIYYVSPTPHGATVTRIHVSGDGDFTTPWPAGFFPERLEELG
jgi:hypothetical protein